MTQIQKFITWPAIAGLLAALLILDRWILPPLSPAGSALHEPVSYARAVSAATPSVVNIYTAKLVPQRRRSYLDNSYFGRWNQPSMQRQRIERALGSGVIMDDQGHIITNNHVIADADAIQVLLSDGRSAAAVVIGTDPATDLAVLKIQLANLQPVILGDSDTARVGDVVLAIGNPLGFRHTVTQGIISALGRFGLQPSIYEDYIQTDAIIHQGNSGGALIDTRGRLLGINTLIFTAQNPSRNSTTGIGISLAIPVNLAVFVMQDLIDFGEVIRGWLGVSAEPTGMKGATQALTIVAVAADSPAQKAGLQAGDIITHIDGEAVQNGRLTMLQIAMLKPGDLVNISLQRNHQSLDVKTVVGVLNQSTHQRTER